MPATRAPARTHLQRLLEVRGLVGGHATPTEPLSLTAADGTRLAASWLAGPTEDAPAVVLAHGFAANRRKPAYALLADALTTRCAVLTLDLRGHGDSSGTCSLGDREAEDVHAAVTVARARATAVVALGVSMGATAVLHAAATGTGVDAVVVMSAPAWLGRTDTLPMARLDRMWREPWRRHAFRAVTGVRLASTRAWRGMPHPVDLAAAITAPLLIVHGEDDRYFPISDAADLARSAGGRATVWQLPRFGHAEDGLDFAFGLRVAAAIEVALRDGAFPDRTA